MFGAGAMTNSIEDFDVTDCVFVIGSNTTECHPVIGSAIKRAVLDRGTKLIVADPRRIELAELASLHLQQKGGTDVALINAMMRVILEEGLADEAFIAERTEGFEDLKANLGEVGQNDVGVVTRRGVLVNANTRAVALRDLGKE